MLKVGIVLGGSEHLIPSLDQYVMDYWIGCDRGALFLIERNIKPDLAIGDFDSVSIKEFNHINDQALVLKKFSSDKDKSDFELALDAANQKAFKDFYIFGATGGRLDHELMNLFALIPYSERGKRFQVIDQINYIKILAPGEHKIEEKNGVTVSFVPITPMIEQLTLKGFAYPLSNQNVSQGSTLTLSNQLLDKSGDVTFTKGLCFVIQTKNEDTSVFS